MEMWDEGFIDISSTDFERLVRDMLANFGRELKDIDVKHNQKIETDDGEYQIDVLATFLAFGADFKVVVECKHHKNAIKRELVQILHDKVRSLGVPHAPEALHMVAHSISSQTRRKFPFAIGKIRHQQTCASLKCCHLQKS